MHPPLETTAAHFGTIPSVAVVFGLLALVGAALIVYGLSHSVTAIRILRLRPTDGLSIADDESRVCVQGPVRPVDETLPAPFTDDETLVVEYEVEERRQQGKTRSWVTIDEGAAGVPFVVDAGSADVRIDPTAARYSLARDYRLVVDGGETPPDPIQRFIEHTDDVDSEETSLSIGPIEIGTGRRRRYTQRHLLAGDEATVVGATSPNPDAGIGEAKAAILDGSPFVVSDTSVRRTALRLFGMSLVPIAIGMVTIAIGWVIGGQYWVALLPV
ncbi:hypothetical protein [Halalkalirubrum salinum]|uniref:hypothetical protein n=1 Tax=Halalkalirubrum salinum TaxID=2563889 RepID=UPI001F0E52ED|nr:hypothetical protein [Halalkalirubrum salinum]